MTLGKAKKPNGKMCARVVSNGLGVEIEVGLQKAESDTLMAVGTIRPKYKNEEAGAFFMTMLKEYAEAHGIEFDVQQWEE